ncbi:MAG: two-component system histidine kinase PnpS [Bacillota bacterium]
MWKWNDLKLKYQFLILFFLIILLVLGLVFYYFTYHQRRFHHQQLEQNLLHQAILLEENQNISFASNSIDRVDSWVEEFGNRIDSRITIINQEGTVIGDTQENPREMDNHADRPEIRSIKQPEDWGQATRFSDTLKKEMFYLALPRIQNGEIVGYIRVAKSLSDIRQVLRNHTRNYLFFIVVLFFVISLIIFKFTSRIINPITRLTVMAKSIARGDYDKRVTLNKYNQEMGILTEMFNHMADKLAVKIKEISEEKNRVKTILENMLDGVIAVDSQQSVEAINPAAREMLKIGTQQVEGKTLIEAVRNYQLADSMDKAIKENRILSREISFKEPERIFLGQFAPLTGPEDSIAGGVIVLTDITELRKLEQVRKDFVANVSHELRTPLTSIIGYLDTLLTGNIDEEDTRDHFLEIVKSEADRLKYLINDLFELTEVEDKEFMLQPESLVSSIDKVIRMFRDKVQKKDIELVCDVEEDLPRVLMAAERIEQVLINLVDNAIKYTGDGGRVVVRAYREEKKVFVEVEDNGPGISEKDQDRIFERFYRVDKARSRKLGGTGIGLSIVKHIIQGHNSEIKVESQSGSGSKFKFFLRIEDGEQNI